jgi:hypothetical protein
MSPSLIIEARRYGTLYRTCRKPSAARVSSESLAGATAATRNQGTGNPESVADYPKAAATDASMPLSLQTNCRILDHP